MSQYKLGNGLLLVIIVVALTLLTNLVFKYLTSESYDNENELPSLLYGSDAPISTLVEDVDGLKLLVVSTEQQISVLKQAQNEIIESIASLESQLSIVSVNPSRNESGEVDLNEDVQQEISDEIELSQEYYQDAEDEFFNESYDVSWDSEMSSELSGIEIMLEDYSDGSVTVMSQECRSSSCRLVLEMDQGAPPINPVMLAANGASKMVYNTGKINDRETVTIIYQK